MGKASFTMGLFGITEGAIPFAAQDPLRIIPANMFGAMLAAVIAALVWVTVSRTVVRCSSTWRYRPYCLVLYSSHCW